MLDGSWFRFSGRIGSRHISLAACGLLATALLFGCSEEDPVRTNGGTGGEIENPGFITGHAYLFGAPEMTHQVIIEFIESSSGDKVDETTPDDEGLFLSIGLESGTYDVFASADVPGYGVASVSNVVVVEGQTTNVNTIDVPDTSFVQILNVAPSPFTAIVPRRPGISADFVSTGSGIKDGTFSLVVNGEQVYNLADLTIADDFLSGSFTYDPLLNLRPGYIDVEVRISNRAGNQTFRAWRFSVLDGIQRRVPDEYDNILSAYWAANDGDTLMVGPGTHTVNNLEIDKEVVILAEAFHQGGTPDQTVLLPGASGRHFRVSRNVDEATLIRGFEFRGGLIYGQSASGGAILCFSCEMIVESCDFIGNKAIEGRGGAIAMLNNSNMQVRDCRFIDNLARRGGAIAMFDRSRPTIERCQFIRNEASADGGVGGLGGAIYLLISSPHIERSTFYGNIAGTSGGAMMADAASSVGSSAIDSFLNLFVLNEANSGVIHLHNQSSMDSSCDGFQRSDSPLFTGTGRIRVPDRQTILESDEDPGFCDAAAGDLHLRSNSLFLHPECETPGALPIGCSRWW